MPYTMNNLQAGIDQIRQGEYVDFEVPAAYHAIIETQDLGNDWNVFINNALTALLNAMFEKLSFDDVKDYIEHENELPRRKRTGYPFEENSFSYRRKRRGIQPKAIQHGQTSCPVYFRIVIFRCAVTLP